MRSSSLLKLVVVLALGAFAGMTVRAQQDLSQSTDAVADAARKSREQQKTAPKPKRVITNDDIPAAAPAAETKAGATGTADATQTDDAADKDPNSETAWRKRFKKVRDRLADSEKELGVLQRELDKDQVQYYPDPQKALMQQYNRSDINDHRAKIDAKQKEIDGLKQQLSDMEDELRKAGGDPGWAR
jgi:chromosome segregation ATPase